MKNIEVEVLVNGSPVKQYYKDGRIFIEAKENSNYSIKVKNNHNQRILAVLSCDGLSAIDGKKCKEAGSGYVINAYDSFVCRGFRISDDEVAQFKFERKEKSYAASKSAEYIEDCGVIGVFAVAEKIKYANQPVCNIPIEYSSPWNFPPANPWYPKYPKRPIAPSPSPNWYNDYWCHYGNSTVSCADDSLRSRKGNYNSPISACSMTVGTSLDDSFSLGTAFGEKVQSKVTTTEFEKGEVLDKIEIYYMTRENLIKNGIIDASKPKVSFPKAFTGNKYCEPPDDWKVNQAWKNSFKM